MVKNSFLYRIEPFIVYIILYFPVFYSEKGNPADIYNDNNMMMGYSVISLFQIFFLLYFMKVKKTEKSRSGIKNFSFNAVTKSLIYLSFLILIIISLNLFLNLFTTQISLKISKSALFILKAFCISVLTGYREETFFRSYFISASEQYFGEIPAVIIGTLLFSISHISGGFRALLSAFSAGLFLSYIFIKHRNLHINALTHSLYNFTVLMLS